MLIEVTPCVSLVDLSGGGINFSYLYERRKFYKLEPSPTEVSLLHSHRNWEIGEFSVSILHKKMALKLFAFQEGGSQVLKKDISGS